VAQSARDALTSVLGDRLTATVAGVTLHGSFAHRHYLEALAAGRSDPLMMRLFCAAVRPGTVVLDIGALLLQREHPQLNGGGGTDRGDRRSCVAGHRVCGLSRDGDAVRGSEQRICLRHGGTGYARPDAFWFRDLTLPFVDGSWG
jgi:hypothetical protein